MRQWRTPFWFMVPHKQANGALSILQQGGGGGGIPGPDLGEMMAKVKVLSVTNSLGAANIASRGGGGG